MAAKNHKGIIPALKQIIILMVIMWVIEIINMGLGHRLNNFGIIPRSLYGLPGIFFSPFLHGSPGHLLVNTLPFIILGWLIAVRGISVFTRTFLFILIAGGLGVWLFGRSSSHIGASGIIFGFFGYLVARGIFSGSFGALIISVIIIFLYGGLIWGILPTNPYISWEGHLFGLIAGIFAARSEKKVP